MIVGSIYDGRVFESLYSSGIFTTGGLIIQLQKTRVVLQVTVFMPLFIVPLALCQRLTDRMDPSPGKHQLLLRCHSFRVLTLQRNPEMN